MQHPDLLLIRCNGGCGQLFLHYEMDRVSSQSGIVLCRRCARPAAMPLQASKHALMDFSRCNSIKREVSTLRSLLARHRDLVNVPRKDHHGYQVWWYYPIHEAMRRDESNGCHGGGFPFPLTRLVVEAGADLTVDDKESTTVTQMAVALGNIELLEYVLDQGAPPVRFTDLLWRERGWTGERQHNERLARVVLERGASVDDWGRVRWAATGEFMRPLLSAAYALNLHGVRFLLEEGAVVDTQIREWHSAERERYAHYEEELADHDAITELLESAGKARRVD